MSQFRAVSRYTKSLLNLAVEKGVVEEVHHDMQMFRNICDDSREFKLMLKSPVIKHLRKRSILKAIFEGKVSDLTMSFFDITTRKNRESILLEVAEEFHNQYNIYKGVAVAKVTTAVPLTKDVKARMEEIVKEVSSMKKVDLLEVIDKDLIGGFVLRIGDRQIDDSIKSKLKALELRFSDNPYIKEF